MQRKVENILANVDHTNFDSVEGAMESILDLLEKNPDDPYVDTAVQKAEELKEEARILLRKERDQIRKEAEENGISLSELGMDDDDSVLDSESNHKRRTKKRDVNDTQSKCCLLI